MENGCIICRHAKVTSACGICEGALCRKCVQQLDKGSFAFLEPVPPELTHRDYCPPCFTGKVYPELTAYESVLARAKNVFVFDRTKGEETRLMSRSEKPIRVDNCTDRDEALLKLAFLAAKRGFNALLDVHLTSTQIRNAGYQTSLWQGTGVPTRVDAEKLEREDRRR